MSSRTLRLRTAAFRGTVARAIRITLPDEPSALIDARRPGLRRDIQAVRTRGGAFEPGSGGAHGRGVRTGGAERGGQDHAHQVPARLLRAGYWPDLDLRCRPSPGRRPRAPGLPAGALHTAL